MLINSDTTLQEPEAEAAELEMEAAGMEQARHKDRNNSAGRHIAKAAAVLMAGTILSRIVGIGRESSISYLFGVSGSVDAFTIANHVATIVYDLLISGTVSAALVPVLSEYATREEDRAEFGKILSTVLTVSLVFLVGAVALLEVFAEPLVLFMSDQPNPGTQSTALLMTQWVLPGVIFMGLSGVVMAAHYALNRFVYPAFTSTVFNASIIFCAFALTGGTGKGGFGVTSLAVGLVVGAIGMLVLQAPGLRDIRIRPSFDISHPAIRKIFKLYAPVGISVVISSVALIVDRHLASQTGEGSISAMRYATTLVQFGLGLVAAAISLASLPSLSQHFSNGDTDAYKRTLASGIRLVTAMVLPAAAAIFALATPLVGLIFRHGAFTAADQDLTALVLLFYVPGLPFSAIDQVLIFAFYARKNTITPVLVGAAATGVYFIVALSTVNSLGVVGLVIANSAQLTFHAVVTGLLLWKAMRAEGGLRGYGIGETVVKAGAAAAAMSLVCWGAWRILSGAVHSDSVLNQVVLFGIPALAGGALYIGLAWAMRLPELELVTSRVLSRVKRRA